MVTAVLKVTNTLKEYRHKMEMKCLYKVMDVGDESSDLLNLKLIRLITLLCKIFQHSKNIIFFCSLKLRKVVKKRFGFF